MDAQKKALTNSAARLFTLGIKVEQARNELKRLVEQGSPYDSPEMRAALTRFETYDMEWKALEKTHLAQKKKTKP